MGRLTQAQFNKFLIVRVAFVALLFECKFFCGAFVADPVTGLIAPLLELPNVAIVQGFQQFCGVFPNVRFHSVKSSFVSVAA